MNADLGKYHGLLKDGQILDQHLTCSFVEMTVGNLRKKAEKHDIGPQYFFLAWTVLDCLVPGSNPSKLKMLSQELGQTNYTKRITFLL